MYKVGYYSAVAGFAIFNIYPQLAKEGPGGGGVLFLRPLMQSIPGSFAPSRAPENHAVASSDESHLTPARVTDLVHTYLSTTP